MMCRQELVREYANVSGKFCVSVVAWAPGPWGMTRMTRPGRPCYGYPVVSLSSNEGTQRV